MDSIVIGYPPYICCKVRRWVVIKAWGAMKMELVTINNTRWPASYSTAAIFPINNIKVNPVASRLIAVQRAINYLCGWIEKVLDWRRGRRGINVDKMSLIYWIVYILVYRDVLPIKCGQIGNIPKRVPSRWSLLKWRSYRDDCKRIFTEWLTVNCLNSKGWQIMALTTFALQRNRSVPYDIVDR